MKWVFLAFMIALVPTLTVWLKQNPRHAPKVWASIGILAFMQGPWNLYIAPISWPTWTGTVKGTEISLLDAVALAILLSRGGQNGKLPFKPVWLAYIFAAFLSVFQAEVPMASFFYVWQLGRVFLLFAAVASICDDPRAINALLSGMVAGLLVQTGSAVMERAGGSLQVGGTFGHQNLLGMIMHFTIYPALALLLAGTRGWAPKIGPLAGVVTVVLTTSRATIGLSAAGFLAVLILSSVRRWTSRKAMVMAAGVLVLAAAAPVAVGALNQRFAAMPAGDYDERAAFERAALAISADHPMGVGANQYVVVANTQGYSARAGVIWNFGSRSAPVHNSYLLTLAEMGYLGLLTFIALLVHVGTTAARYAWRSRTDPRGDLMLGLAVAVAAAGLHCFYEWNFLTFHVQYMFAICAGMIAALARQMGGQGARQPDSENSGLSNQKPRLLAETRLTLPRPPSR